MRYIKIVFILFSSMILCAKDREFCSDIIIFSYNRPMQLYAFLESLYMHTTSIGSVIVICRASDELFMSAYKKVKKNFNTVKFVMQNSVKQFKWFVMQELLNSKSNYIMFAVDDIIVTNKVDFSECIEIFEQEQCYAFFLRLGLNLTSNYQALRNTYIPPGIILGEKFF